MDMPQGAQLNTAGPGPGGFIDPELYRMGAIGRNFVGGPSQRQQGAQSAAPPRSSIGQMLYENIVGSGDVDTPGERAGELIKGGAAAITRGFADVAALPGNAQQLVMQGSNWARAKIGLDPINPEDSAVGRLVNSIPTSENTRGWLSAATGGASEYRAPGTAGEYISTVGEFAGGAGLATGPGTMIRYGAVPGLASEGAGQFTEGTAAEPWARAVAPIAAGMALTTRPNAASGADERAAAARRLQKRGVNPYAGQVRDSEGLMRAEGTLAPTPGQLNQFTRAALRETGYKGPSMRATPGVLAKQESAITGRMNKIVDIDVPITPKLGQEVMRVADDYLGSTPGQTLPPKLRNVATEILDAASNPSAAPLSGARLREWRTSLGRYTTSGDEAVRDAAHDLRSVIDEATTDALTALGRTAEVAELNQLRTQYRNLLVVADATTRGGRGGASGVLTPERVSTSAKRVFTRKSYAMDRATGLAELARDAEMIIGAAPAVKPGGVRDVVNTGMMALGGATVGAQAGSPWMALGGAAAGAAAPTLGRELARTGLMQSAIMQPQNALAGPVSVAPALLGLLGR
jgi:hypothetical protein